MEHHDGDSWVSIASAAKQLNVSPDVLHRRAGRHFEMRTLGSRPHLRAADVARFERDGIPEPDIEALRDGSLVDVPAEWYTELVDGRPHAAVVIRHGVTGLHPGRELHVGDLIPAELVGPNGYANHGGNFVLLPVDSGVLGALRVLLDAEDGGPTYGVRPGPKVKS